jgi:NADPH:quinone reductase-like Zn-dependent oxidoreductase
VKAVVVHQPGGPEVLGVETVLDPEPGPGEVLVAVRAAGVNHRDVWRRQGALGPVVPPGILGSDAAGEVRAIGPGVTGFVVGDRVVVCPGRSCGRCPACLAGQDDACPAFAIAEGAYAELWVAPEDRVVPMPSGITFEEAAAVGIPYMTAEAALLRADSRPGQSLGVWGATGGLGVAAVQLGRLRGLRVIAVTRRADKADRLLREGAHEVVVGDPAADDLAAEVLRRTGGRGADVVFDSVGQASFGQSLAMAARGGVVVTVGATTGGAVGLDLATVFRRRLTVVGGYLGPRGTLMRLLGLFARGALRPVIDTVLPLAEAGEAHRRLEAAQVFGKIVLTP